VARVRLDKQADVQFDQLQRGNGQLHRSQCKILAASSADDYLPWGSDATSATVKSGSQMDLGILRTQEWGCVLVGLFHLCIFQ